MIQISESIRVGQDAELRVDVDKLKRWPNNSGVTIGGNYPTELRRSAVRSADYELATMIQDINAENEAVVALQENNHIAIIGLADGQVIKDFSAGTVNLESIDTVENDLIELNSALTDVPREPDGVTWIVSHHKFATADEGDLDGGSRGFTILDVRNGGANGEADPPVSFSSENSLEHVVTRAGHYPENRSENKGNEPENVEFTGFGHHNLLFVGSERSNAIFVYNAYALEAPLQVLPAGVGPEGLHAIPSRDLFVAACEVDDRGDKIRSIISIYQLFDDGPTYPTILSADRSDGLPIPWGALSALAADPNDPTRVFTAHDSFYRNSRLYSVDVSEAPAQISDEIVLTDGGAPVTLDLEGVAVRNGGGFWVVSEGSGSVDDPDRPVTSLNFLLAVAADGSIVDTIELPDAVKSKQRRFGFEGVAVTGSSADGDELVYVAFQREWVDDPDGQVRIGRYDPVADAWTFFYYPLESPTSPNGGWVGLSEIVALGDQDFAVIERDNQAGPDETIKKIYEFSIAGLAPQSEGTPFPLVTKTLVRDLIPDLQETGGLVLEKIESLTVLPNGQTLIVNDNDGVNDSNGETQLINLGDLSLQ